MGYGGHQVQLPLRQLRGLVESEDFGFCGALQEQSDVRADEKLAPCVGVFRYSAVNNDMLKELQKLEEDLHRIYELIKRNDTR